MTDVSHSGDYEIVALSRMRNTRTPVALHMPHSFCRYSKPRPESPFVAGSVPSSCMLLAGPENIQSAVRKALANADPNLPVLNMMSFGEQVAHNFNQERLIARLTELFGALALILACVGLYGVTAYGVARRTNEIGVRMALGADRSNVLGLVLRAAFVQLGWGLAIGIPAALGGKPLAGAPTLRRQEL